MTDHAIKLEAQLPANYESREMRLCLTRNGKKWAFGMFSDGYGVPLRSYPLHRAALWSGFRTRKAAAEFAKSAGFPPYAIWNAKKRQETRIRRVL